jgi:hypothetical protein
VSQTCRQYGLGNFPRPRAREEAGEKEEEKEEVKRYRLQEEAYSVPMEKSLMWEKNWHLLLCWNHKVSRSTKKIF